MKILIFLFSYILLNFLIPLFWGDPGEMDRMDRILRSKNTSGGGLQKPWLIIYLQATERSSPRGSEDTFPSVVELLSFL